MTDRPEQPPEGRLIADALARTGLSIRKAAQRAGISYGRWRQVTSGYQNISPGVYAPVRAPAATVARMAAAVGVTSGQLEHAGQRPDAAKVLRDIEQEGVPAPRGIRRTGLTGGGESRYTSGQQLVMEISRRLYAQAQAQAQAEGLAQPEEEIEAEVTAFMKELGLPRNPELSILQWQKVAARLGITFGRALLDFGVADAGDLALTPSPPQPPPRAARSEVLKRA